MDTKCIVIKEGWYYIVSSLIVVVLSLYLFLVSCMFVFALLFSVFFVFFLITLYFFRNPNRQIRSYNENFVLSPADGTVSDIEYDYSEDVFRKDKSIRISIFMSLFNVHVQRYPVSGKIIYSNYKPGGYESVLKPEVYKTNEQSWTGIEMNDKRKISVVQIAGLVAKRIFKSCSLNDDVGIGQVMGHIRFGSRVDIYLPYDTAVFLKVGDNIRAGRTIIGRLK